VSLIFLFGWRFHSEQKCCLEKWLLLLHKLTKSLQINMINMNPSCRKPCGHSKSGPCY
jgi:hypothetical protein